MSHTYRPERRIGLHGVHKVMLQNNPHIKFKDTNTNQERAQYLARARVESNWKRE